MRSHCFFLVVVAAAGAGCVGRPSAGLDVDQDGLAVCAGADIVHGIDVSHYDGTIDWAQVKASGIDFAFMKATEGTTFVDPMIVDNWKGAGDAGVIRGAYHFLRPADDAIAQADFFVATAGVPQKGDLPLALDLEVTDSLSGAAVAMNAAQFLARVQEKTGRAPVVYTSARFWTEIGGPPSGYDQYALWDAHWTTACPNIPPAWASWTFWQNEATGTVPGISGSANVDLDQFNGSLAALQGWVNGDDGADGGVDGGDAPSADAGPMVMAHHGCSFAVGGGQGSGADSSACFLVAGLFALVARRGRATA